MKNSVEKVAYWKPGEVEYRFFEMGFTTGVHCGKIKCWSVQSTGGMVPCRKRV